MDPRRPTVRSLAADTVSALFWLAMTPLYRVVRQALRDELDAGPDTPEPWLVGIKEQLEVFEPHDCRMMRP